MTSFVVACFVSSKFKNCHLYGDKWEKKHKEWIIDNTQKIVVPLWNEFTDEQKKILLSVIHQVYPDFKLI